MKAKVKYYFLTVVEIITMALIISGLFITVTAHAAPSPYEICVARCLLDLPKKGECVEDEVEFWEIKHATITTVERSCADMIRDERINCQIDCVVEEIKFIDPPPAVEYYDTDVKNFPETN